MQSTSQVKETNENSRPSASFSIIEEFKEIAAPCVRDSTLHGLQNIYRTRERKGYNFIWILATVLSSSFAFFMISKDFTEYLEFNVATQIRYFNLESSEFPAIAICNSNPLVSDYATTFLINYIAENYPQYKNEKNLSSIEFLNEIVSENRELALAIEYQTNSLNETERQKMGFQLDELIIKCSFQNRDCDLEHDFRWLYNWNYGNCWIYNYNNGIQMKGANADNSFKIELFAGFSKMIPFFTSSHGFHLMIFNQSDSTTFNYHFQKYLIKTGTETHFALERQYTHKLEYPYSECKLDLKKPYSINSDLIRVVFDESGYRYRQLFCLHTVYRRVINEQCGCVIDLKDVPGATRVCTNDTEIACSDKLYYDEFIKNKFNGKNKEHFF